MPALRLLAAALLGLVLFAVAPRTAFAGPAGGASGSVSTSGAQGSSGFEWPDLVVGGNAISGQFPLQVGIVGYLPKARFAVQYDRQLLRPHWIQVGAALLFDRGDWQNFRMNECGLELIPGSCDAGGVVGFDLYAGYSYKFYLRDYPYLVPIIRGNVGFSWFALPELGGGDSNREQTRTQSWTLNVRPGGGVRLFLLEQLAWGADINLPIGFLRHREKDPGEDTEGETKFLLGIEILPLVIEYRF